MRSLKMDFQIIVCILFVCVFGIGSGQDETVATQTGICRYCSCKDGTVNCYDQNMTSFFTKDEWANLEPFKPIRVDLSENYFLNLTSFPSLPVEILNVSRNRIEEIQKAAFKDLKALRVLDLSYNRLTSDRLTPNAFEGDYSPEEFKPISSLRTLSLAYNDLHSLHQDLFEHLPELVELDLSGNPFMVLDHVTLISISSLPMLKVLRLRSCQLKDIPDKFLHTPRYLERLDLSDNQLEAIPQELEETKNLVFLNLNQNPIVEIDVSSEDYPGFPRLRKLQELHMCNMPELKRIGAGALAGLETLTALHMCCNPKLSEIDPKAMARPDDVGETYVWPPLKELYLQSNNLSEVDSRLVSRWDQLTTLDVSNNPFLCDCSTQWMVDDLVDVLEKITVNASLDMVCREPVEMKGYTMKHLHDIHRTMRCVDRYGSRPERDGAILMGTLIGVLLSVPIMLGLVMLWKRGYFAWIGLRGPVDVSRAFYKRAPADENIIY